MYYNSSTSYYNLTYSIDMFRVKAYVDYDVFSNLEFYLKTYHSDKIDKFWISDRIMQFKYNYRILVEDGKSFFIGFHHNNEKKDEHKGKYNLTLEFNPNKLQDNSIILHILNLSGDWFIRSFDLAVDIKCNILDLIIDKQTKRKMVVHNYGNDNITYEIGTGDKRFKVYNKKIESNLDIQGDLTRIEITRCLDDFPICDVKMLKFGLENFPTIYMNNYIYSISDIQDKTMLPIIFAVQNGYPVNDLSRRYKEKIKKLFEGGHKIRFTDKEATEVLRRTIFSYFINNMKVHWR